jgi:hypothetical protein
MNMTRWLIVVAVSLLNCAWAQDGNYEIQIDGWDLNQTFDFTPNVMVPMGIPTCLPSGDACGDASIKTDNGGDSTPENGPYSFEDDTTGVETFYFNNTGAPITSAEISTLLFPDEYLDTFSCSGGALFEKCGLTIVLNDPSAGEETLDAYFYNPYTPNGIPTVTPEPSQWFIMLIALAAMIVARVRIRKGSVSSSFAQTQRSICPTQDSLPRSSAPDRSWPAATNSPSATPCASWPGPRFVVRRSRRSPLPCT